MTKRIFISSTTKDLAQYRRLAEDVILRVGMLPVGMERFPAEPMPPLDVIKAKLRDCDACVSIIGFRYGDAPPDSTVSYTHLEYLEARRLHIPTITLLMSKNHPTTFEHVDRGSSGERNEKFRNQLMSEQTVGLFESEVAFVARLFTSLDPFRDDSTLDNSSVTAAATAPEQYVEHRYTLLPPSDCIGRNEVLRQLTDWAGETNPDTPNVFLIEALGGMGKSALTWKWFREHRVSFDAQLWWSFYEPNSSFERLMKCFVAYVGDAPSPDLLEFSELEQRFLSALTKRRSLLVFDGLERELHAYARLDAPSLDDDHFTNATGPHHFRKLRDPRFGRVLSTMLRLPKLKLLVTSRLTPIEFEFQNQTLYSVHQHRLEAFSPETCLELFRGHECHGDEAHFLQTCSSLDRYPIVIRALLGEITNNRVAPRDYDVWRSLHTDFDPFTTPEVDRKQRVIRSALFSLPPARRRLLTTLAAFRVPVHYNVLCAIVVSRSVAFPTEDSLCRGLQDLQDRSLAGWDSVNNVYDLHPVIRSCIIRTMGPLGMQIVLASLDKYFSGLPNDNRNADASATTMQIERYNALVGLGRSAEAWNYFSKELYYSLVTQRGESDRAIVLLEALFPDGVHQPAVTENTDLPLYRLAEAYLASGAVEEAELAFSRLKDSESQYHLSIIHLGRMRFLEAEESVRRFVEARDRSTYVYGIALGVCGSIRAALGEYRAAIEIVESGVEFLERYISTALPGPWDRRTTNPMSHIVEARSLRAWCLLRLNLCSEANEENSLAMELADRYSIRPGATRALLVASRLASKASDMSTAFDLASQALSASREMLRPNLEIRCLIELARLRLEDSPSDALEYLDAVQCVHGHHHYTLLQLESMLMCVYANVVLGKLKLAREMFNGDYFDFFDGNNCLPEFVYSDFATLFGLLERECPSRKVPQEVNLNSKELIASWRSS